ncbi:MAG: hypothetical protein QXF12_01620 [Candidatus Aenigmatarchaeota archaeon]
MQKGESGNTKNFLYKFEKYLQISDNLKYLKEKYSFDEVNFYYLQKEKNNIPLIISSENLKLNYEKYQVKDFEPFLEENQEEGKNNCIKFKNKIEFNENNCVTICILMNNENDLFFIEFLGKNKKFEEIFVSEITVKEIHDQLEEIKNLFFP